MQRTTLPVLLSMLISLVAPFSGDVSQTNNRRAAQDKGTVVFCIFNNPEGAYIEPIVVIRGKKYTDPPVDAAPEVTKRFVDTYFRPDQRYRVVFGGGDAGTLTVVKYVEPQCLDLTAEVRLQTTAHLDGEVLALAVSSDHIGRHDSSRRAPTEEERAAALAVVRRLYAQRGVRSPLLKKMHTVNLTAIDIERDGNAELIGSFEIRGTNFIAYNLFVIFERAATRNYKAAFVWYHRGSNVDQVDYESRSLVDVIDLDRDGVAEVISLNGYYEANNYIIYRRQAGRWRPIYEGGGGGC